MGLVALRCAPVCPSVSAAEQSDAIDDRCLGIAQSIAFTCDSLAFLNSWSHSAASLRFGAAQARARKDVEAVPRGPRRVGKGAYLYHSNSRCRGRVGEDHSTYNIAIREFLLHGTHGGFAQRHHTGS